MSPMDGTPTTSSICEDLQTTQQRQLLQFPDNCHTFQRRVHQQSSVCVKPGEGFGMTALSMLLAREEDMIDEWVKIQKHQFEQFGYVIKRLKETKDGGGTLIDHSMVTYDCALGDGGRHDHHDLPILLAGHAGGTIRPGRHLVYPKHTPLADLWRTKLERVGVRPNRFGDSTGVLKGLS